MDDGRYLHRRGMRGRHRRRRLRRQLAEGTCRQEDKRHQRGTLTSYMMCSYICCIRFDLTRVIVAGRNI